MKDFFKELFESMPFFWFVIGMILFIFLIFLYIE